MGSVRSLCTIARSMKQCNLIAYGKFEGTCRGWVSLTDEGIWSASEGLNVASIGIWLGGSSLDCTV